MNRRNFLFYLLAILFISEQISAQTIQIGSLQDEQLRIHSLLSDTLHYSTVNLPFSLSAYKTSQNEARSSSGWWNRPVSGKVYDLPAGFRTGLHPVFFQSTYNTRLPHGENNQAAWYGKGMNPEIMGGGWVTSDYLTISIQPHLVWQQNSDFLHPRFIQTQGGNPRYVAERFEPQLRIDQPFRFGPDPYWTLDWGYSSVRLHYEQFELGLSSEPLWWGPSVRYPLMMSNNAPGIPHAFIGTRERVRIPYLGSIQFRWIVGYPGETDYFDDVTAGETRMTNALNIAWSPAFLETFTVGMTRKYHLYETDGFSWDNVLVMFDPLQKVNLISTQGADGERQRRNQAATFYGRLLLPGANAELYGEFYREDHSHDWRDFLNQPHQNSGWSFGMQKIFFAPLADMYKMNLEFTNLTITQIHQTRPQTYYYTHSRIRHGHTNRGQVLGAAIGPGSNSQFLSVDGYRGDYKVGVSVQRVGVNDTFHFRRNAIEDTPNDRFGDYFRHRVDLNLGLNLLYGPGPFYLNGSFIWTRAYNYGRFDYGDLDGVTPANYERKDRINLQFQMGVTYVF